MLIKVMQKQYQIRLHYILIAALVNLNKGPEIQKFDKPCSMLWSWLGYRALQCIIGNFLPRESYPCDFQFPSTENIRNIIKKHLRLNIMRYMFSEKTQYLYLKTFIEKIDSIWAPFAIFQNWSEKKEPKLKDQLTGL